MSDIYIPDAGYINGIAQESRIIDLSEDQEKALDFVDKFINSDKKFAVIGGCAGSGKSSIIPFILKKYSSDIDTISDPFDDYFNTREVEVCAYTGKAVMVLKRKGIVNASTLHSFLYYHNPVLNEETGEYNIVYKPRDNAYFHNTQLLIVDEASMVSKELFDLISSKSFKVLYIGDHFQLPPVNDNFNIMLNPDFKMEKVLRQNEDNPIIHLAELARTGQKIPLGVYGNSKHTLKFNKEELINYDEIITWTNKSKDMINDFVREQKGFIKDVPQIDDKMIVKANCHSKNLFNGQIVYIMNHPKMNKNGAWKVEIIDELAYNDPFIMAQTDNYIQANASIHLSKEELNHLKVLPFEKKWVKKGSKKDVYFVPASPYQVHLDWGYAITAHSAQGSSWNNVAVILDKRLYNIEDCNRWIYTAITRAEDSVTIYSGNF